MKALLISESDEILNSYAAFFKETGYDTVCYRWLLKAMDNLEEIEPLVVFIDGFGYPRHWKTLAQYIKTSFKNAPLVLLAADLSEEETKKADCLDVHCIRGSIDDEQTRRNILSLLHPEQEPEVSAEPVEEIEESEVPAAEPIQTAEPAELAEQPETFVAALEISEPSEESANPEPTTAPSLNDGESVSARAEELAECGAAPEQPEVEPAEQSAELIAATEPAEIAEPVETADFPEPAEIVEPETFTPEPEISDPAFFAAIAEPEQEPEVPAEFAESIEAPGSAETVFEEPEPIDNEPFFKAVQPAQTSLSRGESVSAAQNEEPEVPAEPVEQFEKPAVQEEKSEADVLDKRNGENEPEAASGDNEVFSFTFFHPRTKTAIYGSTVSFKPPLLYFKPDDSSVLHTLRFGQKSSGVINDKGLASDVSVQIQGFENDSIELCLLK